MARQRLTKDELKTFVNNTIQSSKISGAYNPSVDQYTALIQKVVKEFTIEDKEVKDKLDFVDAEGLTRGIIEEYFLNLPIANQYSDGANGDSKLLTPSPLVPDKCYYSYPTDKSFLKTSTYKNTYDEFINSGNDAGIVNLILNKLFTAYNLYKKESKKRAVNVYIDKFMAASAGTVAYVQNSTVLQAGETYSAGGKVYISKENRPAKLNYTLAQLAVDNWDGSSKAVVKEITSEAAKMVTAIAEPNPNSTETSEAAILELKKKINEFDRGELMEGRTISGSPVIPAGKEDLVMLVKPGVKEVWETTTLSGAMSPQYLSIEDIPVIEFDFDTTDTGVWGCILDKRAIKLVTNNGFPYADEFHNPENAFTNHYIHYSFEVYGSTHTVAAVFTSTNA